LKDHEPFPVYLRKRLFFALFSQNSPVRVIPDVFGRGYFLCMNMKVITPPTDDVMDYKGLSAYLKMSQSTLRQRVMCGKIPFFKIGFSVRFSKRDIDTWLQVHRKSPKRDVANGDSKGETVTTVEQVVTAEAGND
jgi:excisionase family DNA binding protein